MACFYVFLFLPLAAEANDAKTRLQQVESQLNEQKQQAASLDAVSKETSSNLLDLKKKLIGASSQLRDKEEEQEKLEDKLNELAEETKTKKVQLTGERYKLGLLTRALLELSQQPSESLMLQSGLTSDTIHRSIILRAVLPRVKEQAEFLARDLKVLDELQMEMANQKSLVSTAAINLENQRQALDQLVRTRQGLLQRTEEQKKDLAARLASLTTEAKDLHQLLARVEPKHVSHLAPHLMTPNIILRAPVAGHILHPYGEQDADGVTSEGITYSTFPAAPVVAPLAGKVVFAGPFKGYGQIIILQHGGGYHSFLAGFGRIDAEMDQEVDAGEPLGVMPVEKGKRPTLYFEWRRNSEPVNPVGLKD